MFEKASRLKLRFETKKGLVAVEDLWDLPLTGTTSLDNVAKDLNKAVKDSGEESFVVKRNATNAVLELKFDIVKHVIKVKLEEADASKLAVENKNKKEFIMGIIKDKESEDLKGKTIEELKQMVA